MIARAYKVAFLVLAYSLTAFGDDIKTKVIYGQDDRLDVYQVQDLQWRNLARSTAALIRKGHIRPTTAPASEYTISVRDYGNEYKLCENEPFRDQGVAAFCSGFLVGPDLLLTAGHCLRSSGDCSDTAIVFDFALTQPSERPQTVKHENLYRCHAILHTEAQSNGADFAIVRLDRPVQGRVPLTLRSQGLPSPGDELVSIGHPAGLPTKVAPGGIVRSIRSDFLVASLDTYGGNSGSAVLNALSGEVEGILVRGEIDFSWRGSCRVSNQCTQEGCRGEDVTLIGRVLAVLRQVR